jgi:uncharacterized delta-60 repeat protein
MDRMTTLTRIRMAALALCVGVAMAAPAGASAGTGAPSPTSDQFSSGVMALADAPGPLGFSPLDGTRAGGINAASATGVFGQLRLSGDAGYLGSLPYVLVQSSDGVWRSYANPRGARSDVGVTDWTERQIMITDPALAGKTVVRVLSSVSNFTPPASSLDDLGELSIRIAGTAPAAVAITHAPPPASESRLARFSLAVSGQAVATECRLDGSEWFGCAREVAYSNLDEGVHQFEVRVRSAAQVLDSKEYGWAVSLAATDAPAQPADTPITGYAATSRNGAVAGDSKGRRLITAFSQAPQPRLVILRYLLNGQIDTSFGVGGRVIVAGTDSSTAVQRIEEARDGGIYLLTSHSGRGAAGDADLGLLRKYTEDGVLDTSFAGDGMFDGATETPRAAGIYGDYFSDIAIEDDGSVLVGAVQVQRSYLPSSAVVMHLGQDGQVDPSYGVGGIAAVLPKTMSTSSLISLRFDRRTGSALVFGQAYSADQAAHTLLGRLTAAGAVDTTYGADGYLIDVGLPQGFSFDLWSRADGTSYLTSDWNHNGDVAGASFTSSGLPDAAYAMPQLPALTSEMLPASKGPAGTLHYQSLGQSLMRPDGGLYVAGSVTRSSGQTARPAALVVFSFDAKGKLDASFGKGGMLVLSDVPEGASSAEVLDMAPAPSGIGGAALVQIDSAAHLITF